MKFKIHNEKHNDFFIVEGTLKECRKEAFKELKSRNWKKKDCYSEELGLFLKYNKKGD